MAKNRLKGMILREIKLILTNNVKNTTFEDKSLKIYKFDKNESNAEELKKIVIDINKSKTESVTFITNKENLFEFFNRKIICIEEKFLEKIQVLTDNEQKIKGLIDNEQNIKVQIANEENILDIHSTFPLVKEPEKLKNFFSNNIKEVLINYGSIFEINIEKLVKGTTYEVVNKNELMNLIDEDLNLILFKKIITSRLAIVFYRLTYFDLNTSKAAIGRFFAKYFEKSESFKMNLNRNPDGLFFTDLNNKIFRGYKIKLPEIKITDPVFDLKIKIAKNLLKKKVKIEIIAEALELTIEELNDRIFGTKKDNTINKEVPKNKKVQKNPFEDVYIPLTRGINSIGISNNEIIW